MSQRGWGSSPMDFIMWWFDDHYIWSTILTPKLSLIWAVYVGSVGRAFGCFLPVVCWAVVMGVVKRVIEDITK